MADDTKQEIGSELETPLQAAARREEENAEREAAGEDPRDEMEADAVVADVDEYVRETDPDSLADAEAQLDEWEIPTDPLEGPLDIPPGVPLTAVFSAQTEAQANIIKGVLQAAGIPCMFESTPATVLGAGFMTQDDGNWASVLVPDNLAEAAMGAIAEATGAPIPEAAHDPGVWPPPPNQATGSDSGSV